MDKTARAQDQKTYRSSILISSMSKQNRMARKQKMAKPNLPGSKNNPPARGTPPTSTDPSTTRPQALGPQPHRMYGKDSRPYTRTAGRPQRREGQARLGRTDGRLETRGGAFPLGTGKALHQTPRVPEVARACPTVWQVVVQTARIADRRRHAVQDNILDGRRRRGTNLT